MASVPNAARRTTRHHRVDEGFVELLGEDFGISRYDLTAAFIGVPSVPKLQAIKVCIWTERHTDDVDERGRMVRAWARKHGKGSYHPAILDGPELTWGEGV